jgi:uncharacterized protein YbbK (DUF523 family)
MVKYVVSACLAGIPCRFDGKDNRNDFVVGLVRAGRALPLCPEQLGGLGTPRTPSERRDGRVVTKCELDVTEQFRRGAKITLALARLYKCTEAILKARSPSCGSGKIYDGTFSKTLVAGDGVTAKLLKQKGIRVRSEDEL